MSVVVVKDVVLDTNATFPGRAFDFAGWKIFPPPHCTTLNSADQLRLCIFC